jgi:D-glycero-alpha-D-manno-heptose 1-phosphate guanylyltransferase
VALRHVNDTNRYGSVTCTNESIIEFKEKDACLGAGDINGGIYLINRAWLCSLPLPTKFSFEKELMQPMAGQDGFYGLSFNSYFIDIGIPEDYWRAQREWPELFGQDEFLFLDRDGVLNKHLLDDYVRNWSMWEWLPGVLEKMPELAKRYKRIFLISNQQGVGKGVMSKTDLEDINRHMMEDIERAGGRIDRIYTCTELEAAHSPNRKPEIGMALQAQRDYPEVDFHRSVMVGDNVTDIFFARKARMRAVYISKNNPVPEAVRDITDIIITGLTQMHSSLVP